MAATVTTLRRTNCVQQKRGGPYIFTSDVLTGATRRTVSEVAISPHFSSARGRRTVHVVGGLVSAEDHGRMGNRVPRSHVSCVSSRLKVSQRRIVLIVHLLQRRGVLTSTYSLATCVGGNRGDGHSLRAILLCGHLSRCLLSIFATGRRSFGLGRLQGRTRVRAKGDVSPSGLGELLGF